MEAPNPLALVEQPDFDTIRTDTKREVADLLGAIADPAQRAAHAGKIVTDAEKTLQTAIPERDKVIMSVWAYGASRALYRWAGINRNAFDKVLRRSLGLPATGPVPRAPEERAAAAKKAGFKRLPDAASTLPELAVAVEQARARKEAATPYRNDSVKVLGADPYNWKHDRIAETVGLERHSVTELISGRRGK